MIKMGFYDLSKNERQRLVDKIQNEILNIIKEYNKPKNKVIPESILEYASDNDTYIRKIVYTAMGRIYFDHDDLKPKVLEILNLMLNDQNELVRQTSVYSFGEIGKKDPSRVMDEFEMALNDKNHKVRNAVIGALKQMGQKNPGPTFKFAKNHLHDDNPKIRREIVHGIELRGRTHPEDVLPLLEELQDEDVAEVRKMIIHVIGQISYKKGCLEKVINSLNHWKNRYLVHEALDEIIEVHKRYKFAVKTPEEAEEYIKVHSVDL